ncbi:transposase domain-containing protein, partial [Pseudoruegeria sp. SK021]|uniref:transposase domain-containing protein n=1 Tax=Pseudoruegeria sp. SK021 TaxID=1933035 RepID=UPI001F0B464F
GGSIRFRTAAFRSGEYPTSSSYLARRKCRGKIERRTTTLTQGGHDEGGRAWGRIASLIETAKINGVEPFAYLKSTLEAIAAGHPENRIDDLLPWNFQQSS